MYMPMQITIIIIVLARILIVIFLRIKRLRILIMNMSNTQVCCIKHIGQGFHPIINIVNKMMAAIAEQRNIFIIGVSLFVVFIVLILLIMVLLDNLFCYYTFLICLFIVSIVRLFIASLIWCVSMPCIYFDIFILSISIQVSIMCLAD